MSVDSYTVYVPSTSGERSMFLVSSACSTMPTTPRPPGAPPLVIPDGQEYFWTSEWQAGEREAEDDLRAGRSQRFKTTNELIRDLLSAD